MDYPRAYVYLDLEGKDELLNRLTKLMGSKTPIQFQEQFCYGDDHEANVKLFGELDAELHKELDSERYSFCINSNSVSEFFITAAADKNVAVYWVDDEHHHLEILDAYGVWKNFVAVEDSLFTLSSLVEEALDAGIDNIPEFKVLAQDSIEVALECKAMGSHFTPLKILAENYFKTVCRYGVISRFDLDS